MDLAPKKLRKYEVRVLSLLCPPDLFYHTAQENSHAAEDLPGSELHVSRTLKVFLKQVLGMDKMW